MAAMHWLAQLGYRQGAATAWRDSAGNDVYIYLYQFDLDGSAGSWFLEIDSIETHHPDRDGGGVFMTMNGKWHVYDSSPRSRGYVRAVVQAGSIFVSVGVHSATGTVRGVLPS